MSPPPICHQRVCTEEATLAVLWWGREQLDPICTPCACMGLRIAAVMGFMLPLYPLAVYVAQEDSRKARDAQRLLERLAGKEGAR